MSGKGIMNEAVNLLCKEAFNYLHLHRIVIKCSEKNIPSIRVAEKAGFIFE